MCFICFKAGRFCRTSTTSRMYSFNSSLCINASSSHQKTSPRSPFRKCLSSVVISKTAFCPRQNELSIRSTFSFILYKACLRISFLINLACSPASVVILKHLQDSISAIYLPFTSDLLEVSNDFLTLWRALISLFSVFLQNCFL